MISTPTPESASRRTSCSTCSVWATPSAAVGSSRITSRAFCSTERAIATVWRCPPESEETFWRTDLIVRTDGDPSVSAACRSLRGPLSMRWGCSEPPRPVQLHLRAVEHAVVLLLAAEEHVLDDVQVLADREVLKGDIDTQGR